MNRRDVLTLIASSALPLLARAQAVEQPTILYGFPAGSSGDATARRIGERLGGTPFAKNPGVVDNRVGAGGRVALEALKRAPADGSVLALTPFSAVSIYPHVYKKLAYDPAVDFVAVSEAAIAHHGLAVGPMVPATVVDVKGFLAWAKANPDKANYGSPGAGSTPHFVGALLGLAGNVELRHVPYRGSAPGITDLLGGQVAAMVTSASDFVVHHKAGKLRLLASTGPARMPFTPDVPTFGELGFSELVIEEWFGFYAPARTPANVVAAANAAINAALKEKSVIDALYAVGLIAHGTTSEEMARSQKAEFERWGPRVKRIGFTADS